MTNASPVLLVWKIKWTELGKKFLEFSGMEKLTVYHTRIETNQQ